MTKAVTLPAQTTLDDSYEVQEDERAGVQNPFIEEAFLVHAFAAVDAGPDRRAQVHWSPPDTPLPLLESHEHGPGRPRRAWPWVLVIVLLLSLTGTAYLMLTNRNGGGSQLAFVPAIGGLSEADAMAMVEDGQTAGNRVSSADGRVAVPNIVGMSRENAAAELRAVGLDVSTRTEVSTAQPIGTVLRQHPEADQQVDAGTAVAITVAGATNTVTVPLLSGMGQDSALTALESMDLTATVQAVASQLPGGTVVGQDPAAGTEVQPGSSVTVNVSNSAAPAIVMVPAVATIGLTRSQAQALLAQYGLKARVITQETPNFRPGLCIYQRPAAGIQVKTGSTVTITIARVPTTTTITTVVSPPPS